MEMIQTSRWLKPLFPTKIEIIEGHVIIIYQQLFSQQRIDIDVHDIYNVEVDSVLGFAELVIYSRMFVDNTIRIPKLYKSDAERFQSEINVLRKQPPPTINMTPTPTSEHQ